MYRLSRGFTSRHCTSRTYVRSIFVTAADRKLKPRRSKHKHRDELEQEPKASREEPKASKEEPGASREEPKAPHRGNEFVQKGRDPRRINEFVQRERMKGEFVQRERMKEGNELRLRDPHDKLQSLRSLTRKISHILSERERQHQEMKKINDVRMPSEIQSETLFKSLEAKEGDTNITGLHDHSLNSTVSPTSMLPPAVTEKLGLSAKFLVSKTDQRWPLVLAQLQEAGGLEGLSKKDIRKFIDSIPVEHLKDVIPQLENMMQSVQAEIPTQIAAKFMKGLAAGRSIDDATIGHIERYAAYIRNKKPNSKLPQAGYETLIEAYGKVGDMLKLNKCLEEMQALKMHPGTYVYSNILTTCVYKVKNHKQAVEIFNTMKFLSNSSKPGTRAYQDIIVSHVNADDIEKAFDLYQEMLTHQIPINQKILITLARGCTSRPLLRNKAWDFMFEIYNQKWVPTSETLEYILYLSAKEGDVALARVLFKKLHYAKTVTARSFGFLLLAYSKAQFSATKEPFPITLHEKGKNFRRNLLADAHTIPMGNSPESFLPFLPISELVEPSEVMAESSAIWAHALMFTPEFINRETCTTFLNIAAEMGSLADFIDRYENFTYLDRTGLSIDNKVIVESPEDAIKSNHGTDETNNTTKSPLLNQIEAVKKNKTARSSLTYVIGLKVAGKHNNYNFAQSIWSERGLFRKTNNFKVLSRTEKDALDFNFASSMILCLTKMNLLEDALAVLLSTEYQFKWTWKELSPLYRAAVEIGDDAVTKTLRGIAKRAQINFEGKIRRKDYKKYFLEKGF